MTKIKFNNELVDIPSTDFLVPVVRDLSSSTNNILVANGTTGVHDMLRHTLVAYGAIPYADYIVNPTNPSYVNMVHHSLNVQIEFRLNAPYNMNGGYFYLSNIPSKIKNDIQPNNDIFYHVTNNMSVDTGADFYQPTAMSRGAVCDIRYNRLTGSDVLFGVFRNTGAVTSADIFRVQATINKANLFART